MKTVVKTKDYSWRSFDNLEVEFDEGWMAYIFNRGWCGPFFHRYEAEDFLDTDTSTVPNVNLYTRVNTYSVSTLGDIRKLMKKLEDLDDDTDIESSFARYTNAVVTVINDRIFIDVEP